VVAHYFEEGNVQLQTKHEYECMVPSKVPFPPSLKFIYILPATHRRHRLFAFSPTLDDDDENKSVWLTWAVGVLLGVRDLDTYNRDIQSDTEREFRRERRLLKHGCC
jgi:hypothetical protein